MSFVYGRGQVSFHEAAARPLQWAYKVIDIVMCMSIGKVMVKIMGMAMMIIIAMRMLARTTMAMAGLMQPL